MAGEVQDKYVIGGQKVKAKRVKTVIQENLKKFYGELYIVLGVHKDFYSASKTLGQMMRKVAEETVVQQLEFF